MHSLQPMRGAIPYAYSLADFLLNQKIRIASHFNAQLSTIFVTNKPRTEFYSLYIHNSQIKEIRGPVNQQTIVGFVASTGRTTNIADVYDKEELKKIDKALSFDDSGDKKSGFRVTQVLAVPILHDSIIIGVIRLINRKGGGRFTDEEQECLEESAHIFGRALHKLNRSVVRPKSLFDFLVKNSVLSEAGLENAFAEAENQMYVPIEEILMKRFRISRKDIGRSLEDFYGCRYIPYNPKRPIPGELLRNLKRDFLLSELWVPLEKGAHGKICVILDDPSNLHKRDMIENHLKTKSVEYCVALKEDIIKSIKSFYYHEINPHERWETMVDVPDEFFAPPCKSGSVHTVEAIAQRLKMLEDSTEPQIRDPAFFGAIDLCYNPPTSPRIEYVCPICRDITRYALEDYFEGCGDEDGCTMIRPQGEFRFSERGLVRPRQTQQERAAESSLFDELTSCRQRLKEIHGIKVEIDESQFCHTCRPDVKKPALALIVDYGNFCKVTPGVGRKDLQLLADFMKGRAQTDGPNWRNEEALKSYLPRLKELLGIQQDL